MLFIPAHTTSVHKGATHECYESWYLQRTVNTVFEAWSRSQENQGPHCEGLEFHVKKWEAIQVFAFSFPLKKSPLQWRKTSEKKL